MNNKVSLWICCLMAAVMLTGFMAPEAVADADKDAKRETRHMQAQLSAAQKEKAALAVQVDDLKMQISELGSKSAALEKKSGGQRKQFAELTEKFQETDKNLQQMTQQYSEANKTLQQVQKEKEQEQKRLSGDIQVCEKKNAGLYQISVELMDKYQSKGIFTSLLQAEPFTQLERVKVQNLLQEYKDKADAAKVASAKVPVSPPVNDAPASASSSQSISSPVGSEPVSVAPVNAESANAPGGRIPDTAPANASSKLPGSDVAASASGDSPATVSSKNVPDTPRP